MKFIATSKEERLSEAQGYYSRASLSAAAQRGLFNRWDRQYRGDHEIDGFRVDDEGEIVENPSRADVVWNISFELLEGSIDTNIPQPFVTPELKCAHHVRNARRVENLVKMLLDKQPFEIYNDSQERTVKKLGTAGTNVEWDVESGTHTNVGEVQVTPLRPQNIYPQPGISRMEDCDYVFIDYVTTRAELKRRYSLSDEDVEDTEFEPTYDSGSSDRVTNDEDVVTLTVMWYRNEEGDVCRLAYSGDILLEDDDDYYSRKVEYCAHCGKRRQICEKEPCRKPKYYMNKLDYDELVEDIQCSDGRVIPAMSPIIEDGKLVLETVKVPVTLPDGSQAMQDIGGVKFPAMMEIQVPKMQKTRLPFYKPRKLPLAIRYNIADDDSFWGISDMEVIREHQQECNKLTSRIHEAVMRSGAALMKPEQAKLSLSNGIFDNVIDIGANSDKNQYGLFSYAADITQWLVERNNHKEQAKRLLGITDSFLGQADTTAKSGYAKSVQVAQAAGRLASKKMMKQAHFADIFRIIFELYLAFADEPRAIHHEDDDCKQAAEERFNRYDFYEYDAKTGKWYIDDNYTFSVDPNGALEQQYPQLWELIKADYLAGMYGDPAQIDSQIIAWQHLEKLRYPFARNIVELKQAQKEQMMAQAQAEAAAQGGGQLPEGVPAMAGAISQASVPAGVNMNGGNV
jgi:hypothetical protein